MCPLCRPRQFPFLMIYNLYSEIVKINKCEIKNIELADFSVLNSTIEVKVDPTYHF